jgi:hypothetical protein
MASGESGNSDKAGGFKVTDRRSFTQEAARETAQPAPDATPGHAQAAAVGPSGGAPDLSDQPAGADSGPFPAVDFHTFVLSLGSSALLHLGELEHPDAGAPQKDLPLAKHTIDILVMLEQKTKGNLTAGEEKLMESLLYDLRLRYVEALKSQAK